jgi:glucosylceramidase
MASGPIRSWRVTTEERGWQRARPPARPTRQEASSLVCTGERDQIWEGFGGCFNELGWIALQRLAARDRDRVLDALFDPARDGLRFTFCRLPIGASDYAAEWYSHDEHPDDTSLRKFSIARDREYLIPYIRLAMQRQPGLRLFASPWSPPTWMKFPRAYNYGTLIWEKPILRAYAQYFVKFLRAYAREGIPIAQVHPQNEPVVSQKFPSCVWTGPELQAFIRDHLAPALRRAGLETEIWLGTLNTDEYDEYVLGVLADPAARRCISGVGFQWAGKGAIQRTHQAWPDLRLMQTENECGDGRNTWAHAGYVFNLFQHYLSNGANAYLYWNMVLDEGGESTWGWRQNSLVTVDPASKRASFTPEYTVMKHFSRYIEPGATRLVTTGPWAGNSVLFENPGGERVLVVRNPLPQEERLALALPEGTVGVDLAPESLNTLVLR